MAALYRFSMHCNRRSSRVSPRQQPLQKCCGIGCVQLPFHMDKNVRTRATLLLQRSAACRSVSSDVVTRRRRRKV